MADWSRNLTAQASGALSGPSVNTGPAYATIANQIRKSILAKALPEGTVLLEGPLGGVFI